MLKLLVGLTALFFGPAQLPVTADHTPSADCKCACTCACCTSGTCTCADCNACCGGGCCT